MTDHDLTEATDPTESTDEALRAAWWGHLQTVRWFGGKGSPGTISRLTPLDFYTPEGVLPALRSEIATIDYDDGRTEYYHLLAAYHAPGEGPGEPLGEADISGLGRADVHDATEDEASVVEFVRVLDENPRAAMDWRRHLAPDEVAGACVWRGEQSNTTIVVGAGLFKLFRRVEPGPNLDAEVLTALDGTSAATPALWGRLTGPWPSGQTTDLGMVIERVPDVTDGWELASAACAAGEDFTERAEELGRALRRVHRELADAFGTTTRPGDEIAATMIRRLDAAAAVAGVLDPHVADLRRGFAALEGQQVATQRVHGDFHLGQTLAGPHGWTIIDFEGEPAKTAAERREPDSVWRDVAGMMRSFDYARSAHSDPSSDAAKNWAEASRRAFCSGYCGPKDFRGDLLSAYEVDKAVYEVVYELRNRPTWVSIPMRAILEQTQRAAGSPESKEIKE